MRVLITRPEQDAQEFSLALEKNGHQALIAPLLTTRFHDRSPVSLDGVQAILATSANGVRAFARINTERALTLYAVGPQTAATARELGFQDILQSDGDAVALAAAVPLWTTPEKGILLHIAGENAQGKLKRMLEAFGFTARMETLYGIEAADSLPDAAIAALKSASLDAVTLFSPRSASVFAELVAKAHLESLCTNLIAVSISQAASDALGSLCFAERRVADRPNQDALLTKISP